MILWAMLVVSTYLLPYATILQARSCVCRVLHKCVDCCKRNEPPPAPMQQLMADLPKECLIPYKPWSRFLRAIPCEALVRFRESVRMSFHLFYQLCHSYWRCMFIGDWCLYPSSTKVYFKPWLCERNLEQWWNQLRGSRQRNPAIHSGIEWRRA